MEKKTEKESTPGELNYMEEIGGGRNWGPDWPVLCITTKQTETEKK